MKSNAVLKQPDWEVITTHVLDRHNDYIQLYALRQQDGGWLLSDGGDTLSDAAQSGCDVNTPRFQARLAEALAALGVQQVDGALQIKAAAETFGVQKRCLVQAVLAINDLVLSELSSEAKDAKAEAALANWEAFIKEPPIDVDFRALCRASSQSMEPTA